MSLAPTSHTQADSPPSSPVLGPARDGRLGPFDPSPRAPASAPTHPTLGIRLQHLHSQTLALQEKKDLLDNGHGVPEHRIALQTHVACLARSIASIQLEVRRSEESALHTAWGGTGVPASVLQAPAVIQHGFHVAPPFIAPQRTIQRHLSTLESAFKEIAEPLLAEALLRQLSAHKVVRPGESDAHTINGTSLAPASPPLVPIKRLDSPIVLEMKISAARLNTTVTAALVKLLNVHGDRNAVAHPASDRSNKWFQDIGNELDKIEGQGLKPLGGWAIASTRFMASTYGAKATEAAEDHRKLVAKEAAGPKDAQLLADKKVKPSRSRTGR